MYCWQRVCLLTALSFILARPTAHAALLSHDFQTPGDGLLTYDSQNGREWLDLTVTTDLTFDELQQSLADGELSGFTFANFEDLKALGLSTGLNFAPGSSLLIDPTLSLIDHFVGGPFDPTTYPFATGAIADNLDSYGYSSFSVMAMTGPLPGALNQPIFLNIPSGLWSMAHNQFFSFLPKDPDGGFWLFRAAPIPEPSAVSLCGFAIMLRGLRRRRSPRRMQRPGR